MLSFTLPLVNSQPAVRAIPPAYTIVPETTAANGPLLESERAQLTDAVLDQIAKHPSVSPVIDFVAFERNETAVKRNFTACKTFPGDALWPAQPSWDIFDELLDGALLPTVPIASPCYDSNWGPKDAIKCNDVVKKFTKFPLQ